MKNIFSSLFLFFFVTGCATPMYPPVETGEAGTYHIVKRKETLWSISQKYEIDVELLAEVNRLPNSDKIEKGQRIFIPGHDIKPTARKPKKQKKIEIKDSVRGESFLWPVKGQVISSFGQKKGQSRNNGIDIKVNSGTSVKASKSGTVTFCSDMFKGYGKTIIIDHGNGYQTVYAYNSENLADEGAFVMQGQTIASSGASGRASVPSLHFEIRKKHVSVDPKQFLR